MRHTTILTAACILCQTVTAGATVLLVRPDGSGEFPNIQSAVDAAFAGDVIELTSGTFTGPGNREINLYGKEITIRSQAGHADSVTLDCQGGWRGFDVQQGETRLTRIEDLSITGGGAYNTDGGALRCAHCSPTIRRCKVVGNIAERGGGFFLESSDALIEDCWFEANCVDWGGGAICVESGGADIVGCTLVDNYALYAGGGAWLMDHYGSLERCTLVGDLADLGGGLYFDGSCESEIRGCVIAFSIDGGAVRLRLSSRPEFSCCDLYGNYGGDWVGPIASQNGINGNLSADPCFCDSENGDFHLWNYSPCNQAGLCGLIGAWPIGCTEPQGVDDQRTLRLFGPAHLGAVPNPFTEVTALSYLLPTTADVGICVLDPCGRVIRTLEDGTVAAGHHSLSWDGKDRTGLRAAQGIYFLRLIIDGRVAATASVARVR